MKKTTEYSWKAGFVAGFFVLAIFCIFGWIGAAIETHMQECKHPGCDRVHMEGSKYCASHMSSDEWKQWRQSHCSSRSTSHTATTSTSVYYPSGSRTEESTHSGSNGNTTRRTNSSYSNTTEPAAMIPMMMAMTMFIWMMIMMTTGMSMMMITGMV